MAAIDSLATGNWSAAGTWVGGVPPAEGDTCRILNTHTVTIDQNVVVGADSATAAIDVLAGGTLKVNNPAASYTLTCKGDLWVRSTGTLNIDMSTQAAYLFTLKLNYSAALAELKYKLKATAGNATITLQGAGKTRVKDTLSAQAASGQANVVTTNDNSSNWRAGDVIWMQSLTAVTNELVTIQSIAGTTVTMTGNLVSTYAAGAYAINMTRNVLITSYDASYKTEVDGVGNPCTFDADWVEFNSLVSNGSDHGGVTIQNENADGIDVDSCVFYNSCRLSSTLDCSFSVRANNRIMNFDSNVFYSTTLLSGAHVDWWGGNPNTLIFTNSYFFKGGVGGYYCNPSIVHTVTNCLFNQGVAAIIPDTTTISVTGCLFLSCTSGVRGYDLSNTGTKVINGEIDSNTFIGTPPIYSTNSGSIFAALTFSNNTATSETMTLAGYCDVYLVNSPLTTLTLHSNLTAGSKIRVNNCTGITTGHITYKKTGSYTKQSSVKYSGDNALLMSPTNANSPLEASATVFAKNTETVVYSCYMRKSASMATLPYVELSGAGITTSTATMANTQDDWQLMTVSGVATEDGFCKIRWVAQNASGSVYVDDDQDSFTHWFEGGVPAVVPKPSLTANDLLNTAVQSASWGSGTFGDLMKKTLKLGQFLGLK